MTVRHQKTVQTLLEAMPYIRRFWGTTVVIKYGGAAMTSPRLREQFAEDIVLLRLVGMKPVVVHGGGPEISRHMQRLGMEPQFVDGLRVTDEATMEIAKMVLVGKVNKEIVGLIARHGGSVVKTPGDAVLAAFWRDHRRANHATCALRAGQEILANLPALSRAWESSGLGLEFGIGINSGTVAMGLVGKHHLEPTVVGDAVNVAQRLETLTKDAGYPLIFSESVRAQLQEDVGAVSLDEQALKGRQVPVQCYGLPGPAA